MAPRAHLLLLVGGLIALTACDREDAAPQPRQTPSAVAPSPAAPPPLESPARSPEPSATPEPSASTDPPPTAPTPRASTLDRGAVNERRDPERVLKFYASALAARDWAAAAKVWGQGSGVTAKTLKDSYDRADPPRLIIEKGEQNGGAGSLYYEAPVTLRFGSRGQPQSGTLLLRRVNNVDGATPEQLRWRIERSTIGAGA